MKPEYKDFVKNLEFYLDKKFKIELLDSSNYMNDVTYKINSYDLNNIYIARIYEGKTKNYEQLKLEHLSFIEKNKFCKNPDLVNFEYEKPFSVSYNWFETKTTNRKIIWLD